MGLCYSSDCFPFTGKIPSSPSKLLQLPTKFTGQTFFVLQDDHLAFSPWDLTTDIQWRVQNANAEDWFFITTNSNWEQLESRGLWAILREYPHPAKSGSGTGTHILSIYLHLQRSRGLVHATFQRDGIDVATASWFVTTAAIECMGCQVAVELRDDAVKDAVDSSVDATRTMPQRLHGSQGSRVGDDKNAATASGEAPATTSATRTTNVDRLDWQLRRVDPSTLLLNHINQAAAIIQLRVKPPTFFAAEREEREDREERVTVEALENKNDTTARSERTSALASPSARYTPSSIGSHSESTAFCVHTAETEDPTL